ncbi:tetratricopeptide repeat protein [Methanolobus bombayensis]|uniref:tetratricopeptide repeat protein n=1 Tax=Methanolobus bombayensis TaxID=38023 RepID=UPI001AEAF67D|nr:hypothetical protein [Methanolobus bombayensis]
MQFEKNVVEYFLWESYNIDSRKHLYKIINEAEDATRKEIGKHRILQNIFLLRRGRDPGFALHIYNMIKKDANAIQNTALYIQKLLLDGSYYDVNKIFNPYLSINSQAKKKSIVDKDLKHTFRLPIVFEERGDGLFNIKQEDFLEEYFQMHLRSLNESLEYFNQRYEIALETKDDQAANAIRDVIQEYQTSHFDLEYFSRKGEFYWDSDTEKKDNFEFQKYLSENITNSDYYSSNPANAEWQLAINILTLGFEEKLTKILNDYDIGIVNEFSEEEISLKYIKFLADAFSITSVIWFNSLSLNEKQQLLNGTYTLDNQNLTDYLATFNQKNRSILSLELFADRMYLNKFLDVAETTYSFLSENTEDDYRKAGYLSKLGDINRDKMEFEKAYSLYKELFDFASKTLRVNKRKRKGGRKTFEQYENPRIVTTLSLLRMAEMDFLLGNNDAENHINNARERIERANRIEKLSLMWNLACTYRRTEQFDREYECLHDIIALGENQRDDLVDKADERITQIDKHFSWTAEKLDDKKLSEEEQNKEQYRLVAIAESLRNSFQFERESEYLKMALKIKENEQLKLNLAISKYNQSNVPEAKNDFVKLILSSDKKIVTQSYLYLAFIDFQQDNNQKGLENISRAIVPLIKTLSHLDNCKQEVDDIEHQFTPEEEIEAIEILPPAIKLCIDNLIPIKKPNVLKEVLDNIFDHSAKLSQPSIHHDMICIACKVLFVKGLVEEALLLSEMSIGQLSADKQLEISANEYTAHMYFDLGMHDKSIKYLKDALKIDSQYPDLWKNLGLNYEQLLDFNNAEKSIDKAMEIEADHPGLEKLKEKYNRLKKDTINFNKIKDDNIKKFFMSAERLVLDIPKSVNEDEFDFTMALVSYGKGVESLLHKKVSIKLRKKIHKKHGFPIPDDYFRNLPASLKNILGKKDRTITLGSWPYIFDDCKNYSFNPIVEEANNYFLARFHKNKNIVFKSCKTVSDYRNGSAHYTSKTMNEIMKDRKIIIEQVNNIIDVLY